MKPSQATIYIFKYACDSPKGIPFGTSLPKKKYKSNES